MERARRRGGEDRLTTSRVPCAALLTERVAAAAAVLGDLGENRSLELMIFSRLLTFESYRRLFSKRGCGFFHRSAHGLFGLLGSERDAL